MTFSSIYNTFPGVARASFFKGTGGLLAGSTQSKQYRIELLYRYKRAKTSRITVLNIRKLYVYFVYFKTVGRLQKQ